MTRITNGELQEQIKQLNATLAEMQERLQQAEEARVNLAEQQAREDPEQILFQAVQESTREVRNGRPKVPTKLPSFKGKREEDVRQWMFQIENICSLHGHQIKNENTQLPSIAGSAMEDPASGWYLNWATSLPMEHQTWENFRRSACKQFEPTNYQANLRQKLKELKQNGDIEDYNGEFSKLVFRVEEMSQVDQISYYVSGLKRQATEYVQLEDPSTLLDAMDLARKFEMSRFRGFDEKKSTKVSKEFIKKPFKRPFKFKLRSPNKKVMDTNDSKDKVRIFCKFCKRPGHQIDDCRKLKAKKAKESQPGNANPHQS